MFREDVSEGVTQVGNACSCQRDAVLSVNRSDTLGLH